MTPETLIPEEREAVAQLLRRTISADPFPLAPRLKPLKSALAELDATRAGSRPVDAANAMGQQRDRTAEARQALADYAPGRLLLRLARIVLVVDVSQPPRTVGVDLKHGLFIGVGVMLHAGRHREETASR
jgi:hypothetical protein